MKKKSDIKLTFRKKGIITEHPTGVIAVTTLTDLKNNLTHLLWLTEKLAIQIDVAQSEIEAVENAQE